MKKWRGNGERMRKWREIHSLHFLIFYLFPPSLSISYIKNGLILSQNVEYVTFVTTVTKNLAYALWESNSGSNSLRESSASFASLAPIYGHWDYPLQSSKCPIEIYSWISKKLFHEIERPKKNWYTEHEIYLHVFLALLWSWMWKRSDCREGLCLPDGLPQCGSWLRCPSLPCHTPCKCPHRLWLSGWQRGWCSSPSSTSLFRPALPDCLRTDAAC